MLLHWMIWQLHLEILIYLILKFIGLHCIKLCGNLGSPFKKHLKNWTTKFKARTSGLNKFLLISFFFYHLNFGDRRTHRDYNKSDINQIVVWVKSFFKHKKISILGVNFAPFNSNVWSLVINLSNLALISEIHQGIFFYLHRILLINTLFRIHSWLLLIKVKLFECDDIRD